MAKGGAKIEITTSEGPVRGVIEEELAIFRGVPFARPPIGALRFKAPVPSDMRSEVLDASRPAPICPQTPLRVMDALGPVVGEQDEDCLVATIWAPLPLQRPKPILIWLHGGALCSGGGAISWYDGARLARENDIIVVSPNYRLGALGFLCRPPLVDGNVGFLDQIQALQWVSANAASFGGDSRQITVMGQSAGAVTAGLMLAMPKVRAMFQRVVFLSGGAVSLPLQPAATAANVCDRFCASLAIDPDGPDALQRLQQLPVAQILAAQLDVARSSARVPGNIMPTFMLADVGGVPSGAGLEAAFKDGIRGMDVLVGTMAEEMRLFQALDPRLATLTADALPEVAEGLFGAAWAPRIERARRSRPGATPSQIITDAHTQLFVQSVQGVALAAADAGCPTWLYRVDWNDPDSGYGACHCLDLPFVFGSFEGFQGAKMFRVVDESMWALSSVVRAAIGHFVQTGSPEGQALPAWPRFSRARPALMVFNSLLQHGWLDAEET